MKSNLGQFKKGIIPHNKGKIGVSKTTHNLMSLSKIKAGIIPPPRKGKKATQETIEKMKGRIPWNKGTEGICKAWNKGMVGIQKHSIKTKEKMSEAHRGEKAYQWKGLSSVYFLIRNCFKYRQWRSDVFTKDSFTCQDCGDSKGGNLEAHHIEAFYVILEKNNIKTFEEALLCEQLWNINNGRTLCIECHKKTDNWGIKLWKKQIQP